MFFAEARGSAAEAPAYVTHAEHIPHIIVSFQKLALKDIIYAKYAVVGFAEAKRVAAEGKTIKS